MSLSACLTCRHARKPRASGAGMVICSLDWEPQELMHVCMAFYPLADSFSRPGPSCSASTTATNSHS